MAANAVYCGGGCAPVPAIVLDTGFTRRPVPPDGTCSAGSCRVDLRLIEILGGLSWRILTLKCISGVQAGLKIVAGKLEIGAMSHRRFYGKVIKVKAGRVGDRPLKVYSGKFIRSNRFPKRGSERRLSSRGSDFMKAVHAACSRYAFSSKPRASSFSFNAA